MGYNLKKDTEGNALVLLDDVLDTDAVGKLRNEIKQSLESGSACVTFDLQALKLLNSQLLGLMIATYNTVSKKAGKLKVINVQPVFMSIFKTMRLETRFQIENT